MRCTHLNMSSLENILIIDIYIKIVVKFVKIFTFISRQAYVIYITASTYYKELFMKESIFLSWLLDSVLWGGVGD